MPHGLLQVKMTMVILAKFRLGELWLAGFEPMQEP